MSFLENQKRKVAEERNTLENGSTFDFQQKSKYDDLLDKIYKDNKHPASFSGATILYYYAKKILPEITLRDVKDYLSRTNVATSFKRPRYKFNRRVVERGGPDEIWQVDTFFLLSLAPQNKGYKYGLVCLDSWSRYLFCRPCKTKSHDEVIEQFRSIIAENGGVAPQKIFSDRGSELLFLDSSYKEFEIIKYSTNSPQIKATQVEKVISIIKKHLFMTMFEQQSLRWIDFISNTVYAYNHKIQKKTLFGLSPAQAKEKKNFRYLQDLFLKRKRLYESQFYNKQPKFHVNDSVKIIIDRTKFSRGYTEKYGPETHIIKRVLRTYPVVYQLHGFKRHFYENELVRAPPSRPLYYVSQTEIDPGQTLRSGKVSSSKIKRYLIKDKNNFQFEKWLTEPELETFRRDNIVEMNNEH